jgi:hypothetical protein
LHSNNSGSEHYIQQQQRPAELIRLQATAPAASKLVLPPAATGLQACAMELGSLTPELIFLQASYSCSCCQLLPALLQCCRCVPWSWTV